MKINSYKTLITLLILIFISVIPVFSQNENDRELRQAAQLYENGQYEKVVSLLTAKMASYESEKALYEQAAKLLIASYSKLDEIEKEEASTYEFLKRNPIYNIQTTIDPQPFIESLDKFSATPRFAVGLLTSYIMPTMDLKARYILWETSENNCVYKFKHTNSFGTFLRWYVTPKLSTLLELKFGNIIFTETVSIPQRLELVYTESFLEINVPLYLKYEVKQYKKFGFSVIAGLNITRLSNYIYDYTYATPGLASKSASGSVLNARNTLNYAYLYGGNVSYHFAKFNVFLSLKYFEYFKLYNPTSSHISNQVKTYDLFLPDDEFKINKFDVSLGISYTLSYKILQKFKK